jgi:hypothetical protein
MIGEHFSMPSNFLISLTESIYFPPFQVLVGEKKLPPFPSSRECSPALLLAYIP